MTPPTPAPAVKVVIAQAVHAAAGVVAKVTPKVDMTMVPQQQNRARAGVPMGSAAALKAAVIAAALKVSRAAALTVLATAQTVLVTVLPAGNRIAVAVAKRLVPVATGMPAKRNRKERPADADPDAAHARPENPAAVVAPTVKSNSAGRELLQSYVPFSCSRKRFSPVTSR
jgi:hypothetical protein